VRRYASAVYAVIECPLVCLSVCHSSTKMVKSRITNTTLYDSPGTLVCLCQRFWQNSNGVTAYRGPK